MNIYAQAEMTAKRRAQFKFVNGLRRPAEEETVGEKVERRMV